MDIKSLQYHCTLQVLVIGGKSCELFWVETVLDSRSGITCMHEKLAWRLEAHFSDDRLAYSFPISYSIRVADGRKVAMTQQTQRLYGLVHTTWGSVVKGVGFAVIPGTDDVLVLGVKTLHDESTIGVMQSLQVRIPVIEMSVSAAPQDEDVVGGSASS